MLSSGSIAPTSIPPCRLVFFPGLPVTYVYSPSRAFTFWVATLTRSRAPDQDTTAETREPSFHAPVPSSPTDAARVAPAEAPNVAIRLGSMPY